MLSTPEGTVGDGRKRGQGIWCAREEACRADDARASRTTSSGLMAPPDVASWRELDVGLAAAAAAQPPNVSAVLGSGS